jgi:hypothetical protein
MTRGVCPRTTAPASWRVEGIWKLHLPESHDVGYIGGTVMTESATVQDDSPFARAIVKTELSHLRELAADLERYDATNADDFAVAIDMVLRGRFNQTELAAEFKVSAGTISRWRSGRSCPPQYARATIIDRIREMLIASANEIKVRTLRLAA